MTTSALDDFIALVSRPVFYSKPFWETKPFKNKGWSPMDAHGIQSVIESLEENN